jgi:O-antigen biosynthesis protein
MGTVYYTGINNGALGVGRWKEDKSMQIIAEHRSGASYETSLPAQARGRWCIIAVRHPRKSHHMVAKVMLKTHDHDVFPQEIYLEPLNAGSRFHLAVAFAPHNVQLLRLDLFGDIQLPIRLTIGLRAIPRFAAALVIGLRHPVRLVTILRGSWHGWSGRLREALAIGATGYVPGSYSLWTKYFDTWSDEDRKKLLASPLRNDWPQIAACVFGPTALTPNENSKRNLHALKATQDSLNNQIFPGSHYLIDDQTGVDLSCVVLRTECEYLALIQAGERLPDHALALFADQLVALGRPDIVYGDEDLVADDGRRLAPHFKPQPSHTLMLSGTLITGVWVVRRELLIDNRTSGAWAEVLRLDLWLRLYEANGAHSSYRLPYILTHRSTFTESPPPDALVEIVNRHLERSQFPARVEAARPLKVYVSAPQDSQPKVSIVVPSACRLPHVPRCISAVLERTDYRDFELLIAISQATPLDGTQRSIIGQLTRDTRVRHILVQSEIFNYALTNNIAVGQVDGELVCLLNDDVEPLDAGWLAAMAGHFGDPRVGVVGTKLYYPNRLVQHGGILMGLAGLCEHANRFLREDDPGYAWRGALDQELSAVTGACLMIRRNLYVGLGGLDTSFATAFNDVDLCLRARDAGHAVVFSAGTKIVHYESSSFGRHYTKDAADREAADIARMRTRWASVCAADPFHNPNLSLRRGNEWALSFGPRVNKPPICLRVGDSCQ